MGRPYESTNPAAVSEQWKLALEAEDAGNRAEAEQLYEQILSSDPAYPPACINLGTIYYHLGHFASAEDMYRRAFNADPEYALAAYNLANVLEELGRMVEAIEFYECAIALNPCFADAHFNLARLDQWRGRNEEALGHWQEVLRLRRYGQDAEDAAKWIRVLAEKKPQPPSDAGDASNEDRFFGVLRAPYRT